MGAQHRPRRVRSHRGESVRTRPRSCDLQAGPMRGADDSTCNRDRSSGRASASVHDRIDDMGQLAAGVGQGIKIVLAGAARLDQAAMTQQSEMMADRRLALGAQIRAELGDIALFFVQEYQHLQAGRIGDLLEQLGDATDLGRRSGSCRSGGFRRAGTTGDLVDVGGILFLKRKS